MSDELDRRTRHETLKNRINAGQQFENQSKRKYDEIEMAKLREVEERRLIEAQIRVANEAEAKA